jgi:hypothetical protein
MLQIVREDSVSDWPADVLKPLCPRAGRFRAVKLVPKFQKALPDPTSISTAKTGPPSSARFEDRPVFLTVVAVSDLRGIDDPWKPMTVGWLAGSNVGADVGFQTIQFGSGQAMLKGKDGILVRSARTKLMEEFELVKDFLLPPIQAHGGTRKLFLSALPFSHIR